MLFLVIFCRYWIIHFRNAHCYHSSIAVTSRIIPTVLVVRRSHVAASLSIQHGLECGALRAPRLQTGHVGLWLLLHRLLGDGHVDQGHVLIIVGVHGSSDWWHILGRSDRLSVDGYLMRYSIEGARRYRTAAHESRKHDLALHCGRENAAIRLVGGVPLLCS